MNSNVKDKFPVNILIKSTTKQQVKEFTVWPKSENTILYVNEYISSFIL